VCFGYVIVNTLHRGDKYDNNNNNNNNNTHNLTKTIGDKQNKYQELANEICAMFKQKAVRVIPIVISSTAVIPKSLSQSLKDLTCTPIHTYKCKNL
jgi:hypothetical protein